MTGFEDDLRRALRVDPVPADLTDRIMRHVDQRKVEVRGRGRGRSRLAIAATILLAGGLWFGREVRRNREGERVKNELMVGLRVTGASLREVQERVFAPLEALSESVEDTAMEE